MDPFVRAVKIFTHQMLSVYSGLVGIERKFLLQIFNNSNPYMRNAVSFLDWLRALDVMGTDHDDFDVHVRLQITCGELQGLVKYDLVCKLEENLPACLQQASIQSGALLRLPPKSTSGGVKSIA